jgi:hypothetical protein
MCFSAAPHLCGFDTNFKWVPKLNISLMIDNPFPQAIADPSKIDERWGVKQALTAGWKGF